jgi:hypothetical protein
VLLTDSALETDMAEVLLKSNGLFCSSISSLLIFKKTIPVPINLTCVNSKFVRFWSGPVGLRVCNRRCLQSDKLSKKVAQRCAMK